ncbi:hypothetical protein [Parasphingorhabdus sp.]|uniref:hypothetical protein n=1 Tax=Parasphingorhabdus sp. TaxID=2709688 RepID=UPI0032ED4EC7
MFGLFDPPYRRVKDDRELRYFYMKYGPDAITILDERANDIGLTVRDRRHWRRLARKARQRQGDRISQLKSS